MASRSRTTQYIRCRQARRRSGAGWGDTDSDQAPLFSGDIEPAGSRSDDLRLSLPPEWVDDVDQAHEHVRQIRSKMEELSALHSAHAKRGAFDPGVEEERAIEIMTQEITSIFHRCQKVIQTVGRKGQATGSDEQQRLTKNVQQSLAQELQALSSEFRKHQSTYLKRMRAREDDEKRALGINDISGLGDETADDDDLDIGFTDEQQRQLHDNTMQVEVREQEILNIVRSITELSTIFKDLATLIVDQGTILDRIDYNIETASYSVEEGRKQLEQGEKYQKKAYKKMIIVLLCILVVAFVFALILKKKLS
eukprot:m.481409 g.481409  ORF g.481409 m.481409 type:complete len:309 (-) comp22163_c0_seq1:81-1007(-)